MALLKTFAIVATAMIMLSSAKAADPLGLDALVSYSFIFPATEALVYCTPSLRNESSLSFRKCIETVFVGMMCPLTLYSEASLPAVEERAYCPLDHLVS